MMKLILPILGIVVIAVLAYFTAGVILVPAFPFIVLCLQKLGVVPK